MIGVDTLYQQQKSWYLQEYNDNNIKNMKEEFIGPKKRGEWLQSRTN